MTAAPRIYDLSPGLAGPSAGWAPHCRRARSMGFDWINLNLPATAGDEAATTAALKLAVTAGLRPMLSLAGAGLDAERLTAQSLAALRAGAAGLCCEQAHLTPPGVWEQVLAAVRRGHPDALFLAAALGCPFPLVEGLARAGFGAVLDSSYWWDLRATWLPDQLATLAPHTSWVAFPEERRGPRLARAFAAADTDELELLYRRRLLAAAVLGRGLLVPMGYEFACTRTAGPDDGTADDWTAETTTPALDLRPLVTAVNAAKAARPSLHGPVPPRRVSAPNARVAGLLRLDVEAPMAACDAVILAINTDRARPQPAAVGGYLTAAGGRARDWVAIGSAGEVALTLDAPMVLPAWEARLLAGAVPPTAAPLPVVEPLEDARWPDLAPARVSIEGVTPEVDAGRFPAKRLVGDTVSVEADIFGDGHDKLAAALLYRAAGETTWRRAPMAFVDNDRWAGAFVADRMGRWEYTVEGWRDIYATWRTDTAKKHAAGQSIAVELLEARALVELAAAEGGSAMAPVQAALEAAPDAAAALAVMSEPATQALMALHAPRGEPTRYVRELTLLVERTAAGFAAWYELFPRSMSDDPGRHGTLDDVIAKLPYVRAMGFDVLYFTPIHPIGRTNRKGRNNALTAGPNDPGSPYAIGSADGGHDALHPELGTLADFRRLVAAAAEHGLELALDFAIQCSPDHPWLRDHPEWFERRPDGSIKYAENPPKKYEDIVNVRFYGPALPGSWLALRDAVTFWVEQGVRIFRVDNPHTKPLPFWEWLIGDVQANHPDTIFLSEAFTRPKLMQRLAKIGFTQSYSYFTWRNTKNDLTEYLTELTTDGSADYMRPNFFVNTPDINPVFLQRSGRPGHVIRAVLAATLSPLWGVYCGFELCEATALPGKEEYQDSEKYQLRTWDWDRPGHIRGEITLLNRLRRDNPALWQFANLEFLPTSNPQVLAYLKATADYDNVIVVAVNLDPNLPQSAHFEVPFWRLGQADDALLTAIDLASGQRWPWAGKRQHIWLDPMTNPFAIWRLVPAGQPA